MSQKLHEKCNEQGFPQLLLYYFPIRDMMIFKSSLVLPLSQRNDRCQGSSTKIGMGEWDFILVTSSGLTLQWCCLLIKPWMYLIEKPMFCILLTEYFRSGEHLSHRYLLILLIRSEIWFCKYLFFFSSRWREYAFRDSKQVRSRKRSNTDSNQHARCIKKPTPRCSGKSISGDMWPEMVHAVFAVTDLYIFISPHLVWTPHLSRNPEAQVYSALAIQTGEGTCLLGNTAHCSGWSLWNPSFVFISSPLYVVSALGARSWVGGLHQWIFGTFWRECFLGGF